jgi:hypothetical protein
MPLLFLVEDIVSFPSFTLHVKAVCKFHLSCSLYFAKGAEFLLMCPDAHGSTLVWYWRGAIQEIYIAVTFPDLSTGPPREALKAIPA